MSYFGLWLTLIYDFQCSLALLMSHQMAPSSLMALLCSFLLLLLEVIKVLCHLSSQLLESLTELLWWHLLFFKNVDIRANNFSEEALQVPSLLAFARPRVLWAYSGTIQQDPALVQFLDGICMCFNPSLLNKVREQDCLLIASALYLIKDVSALL